VTLTPEHREYLEAHAVDVQLAEALGVRSIADREELPEEWRPGLSNHVPGILFPWTNEAGGTYVQLRPDHPKRNKKGDPVKYVFQRDSTPVLWAVRVVPGASRILIVEGSKQCLVAAMYAPPDMSVYGIAGCWGWSHDQIPIADLSVAEAKNVLISFDADASDNLNVWNAGERLKDALEVQGALSVKWVRLGGAGKKAGLDDVLAVNAPVRRADVLKRMIQGATDKIANRKPRAKRISDGAAYFDENGLMAQKLAEDALSLAPAALTAERTIAMYVDGVYRADGTRFTAALVQLLGNDYRVTHQTNAEKIAVALLQQAGRVLPARLGEQLLNVRNGVVDLKTGELRPHDQSLLSTVQLPIEWNPEAECPRYEEWLEEVIPDQIDDLEESASMMLDPTRTPSKALFLYGPSRSGKSTWLRLMEAIAGPEHRSAVTLHQLASDRFAAANVYRKILNSAADLSSAHVEDLSMFKMLTGEDSIQANRKYGGQFVFTNQALFAFSANEIPTVGESSRAYTERIRPFRFDRSFAGREDPAIEEKMLAELPGILVRLVRAWQRRQVRGGYLVAAPAVVADFEARSDRVRLWVSERCTVIWGRAAAAETATEAVGGRNEGVLAPGALVDPEVMTSKRDLAKCFNTWAMEQHASPMGERKIIDRLTSINGVVEVRNKITKARGLNIVVHKLVDLDEHFEDDLVVAKVANSSPTLPHISTPTPPDVASSRSTSSRELNVEKGRGEFATSATLVFDLETASADELWTRGPDFIRLGGFTDREQIPLTTDFADLTRRIETAAVSVGHNTMGFDYIALARHHGLDLHALTARRGAYDTLLAARHRDPPMAREKGSGGQRYGLDALGKQFELGAKTHDLKALAKEFGGFDQIPVEDERYRGYLTGDVELNRAVYEKLRGEIGFPDYLAREHRVAAVAAQISLNGFKVDLDLLAERFEEGEQRKQRALRKLHDSIGVPAVSDSVTAPLATRAGKDALIAALRERGVQSFWTTGKTEDIATSVEAMKHLALQHAGSDRREDREIVAICKLVMQVVSTRSVYQTAQHALIGDRVHPKVVMKQSTGRWSLTNPGLTVFGKRGGRHIEREIFIADPGEVIIAVDLSQVDMRAVAGLSGDQAYLELFRSGADPHAQIAQMLFGDAGMREFAKPIGHGWNYGRGIKAISESNDIPVDIVRQYDRETRENFPRLVEWQTEVRAWAESGELLDNGFGRPMRPDPARAHTQGPALMGQGAARDLMMEGLLRLPVEVLPMLRAQVHDEIVLSVPAAEAAEIQRVVIEALTFEWRGVPIIADGGPIDRVSWGDVYRKG